MERGSNTNVACRVRLLTADDGRKVRYEYGSGHCTHLSRVSYLAEDDSGQIGQELARYSYLGIGDFVEVDLAEPDVVLNMSFGTGDDPYSALDRFGRVVDHFWDDGTDSFGAERLEFGYDAASNRTWRDNGRTAYHDERYEYDGLHRLTDVERGKLNSTKTEMDTLKFAQDWALDESGNWTTFRENANGDATWDLTQSRTHTDADEIETIASSGTHVAYDRAGNMTAAPQPDSWSSNYTLKYDAWNRLTTVKCGYSPVAAYTYDGLHRRVTKTVGATTEHYYYDGWRCIEQRLGSESYPERQYVWGTRYVDDLILRDRDTGTSRDGNLDERLYSLQDPNWNVTTLVKETSPDTWQPVQRFRYTAYGASEPLTTAFATTTDAYDWDYRYTGRREDDETGLLYYRYRMYHAQLGKFLTRDPIGYMAEDVNLYRYVGNRPTIAIDPHGLEIVDIYGGGSSIPSPSGFPDDGPGGIGSSDNDLGGSDGGVVIPPMGGGPPVDSPPAGGPLYDPLGSEPFMGPIDLGIPRTDPLGVEYREYADGTIGQPFGGAGYLNEQGEYIPEGMIPFPDEPPTFDLALDGALTLAGWKLLGAGAQIGRRVCAQPKPLRCVRRFFYDNRKFPTVSKAYWKTHGPAKGRSLHHWLFPQRSGLPQGIRNAGFNQLDMPPFRGLAHPKLGLNQWMGFAQQWGGGEGVRAILTETGIRLAIPASAAGAGTTGYLGGDYFIDNIFGSGREEEEP